MTPLFERSEGVEAAPMRDESLLYVPTSESYCVLNRSAAALWEALSTPSSEEDLAGLLCERFEGVTMEEALSDVRITLDTMLEMSLVYERTKPTAAPEMP